MGVHNDYLRLMGDEAFKPIQSSVGVIKESHGQDFLYHPVIAVEKNLES
jgi:hypothetical protein